MLDTVKLDRLVERLAAIGSEMSSGPDAVTYVRLSKEYAELEPVVQVINAYREVEKERRDLKALVDDADADAELSSMAREEIAQIDARLPGLVDAIRLHLLPKDEADDKSAILEVRAGTGGDEAALFAGDLVRMYLRYAEAHRWKVEIMSASEGEVGGYREFIASVDGPGVFQPNSNPACTGFSGSPIPNRVGGFTPRRQPLRFCPRPRSWMSKSRTRICGSTSSAPAVPAASRSIPPTARCGLLICPPALSSFSRTKNPSIKTGPRP